MVSRLLTILSWVGVMLIVALTLTGYLAVREAVFLAENQLTPPQVSAGFAVVYFLGVTAVMALVLFLAPAWLLKIILRVLIGLLFAWGVFVALELAALPIPDVALIISAVAIALLWFFWPRVWLHNLLLLVALASLAAVYGFFFSPGTFMVVMAVIAAYDLISVFSRFMPWLATRLSQSDALPAFVIPQETRDWRADIKATRLEKLEASETGERDFAILGGGDVGFPLLLAVAVFVAHGTGGFIVMAVAALLGLVSAFLVQAFWLRGKPMPALPPIAIWSLVGLLVVRLL